jgi:hypothetical protein
MTVPKLTCFEDMSPRSISGTKWFLRSTLLVKREEWNLEKAVHSFRKVTFGTEEYPGRHILITSIKATF